MASRQLGVHGIEMEALLSEGEEPLSQRRSKRSTLLLLFGTLLVVGVVGGGGLANGTEFLPHQSSEGHGSVSNLESDVISLAHSSHKDQEHHQHEKDIESKAHDDDPEKSSRATPDKKPSTDSSGTVDWNSINPSDLVPKGSSFINVTAISLHANSMVTSWQLQQLVSNGTKWWQRGNPVRVWRKASQEAGEVIACMYKSEHNKTVAFLTAIGRLQSCMAQMIHDNEQKGLAIPLENFSEPVPTRFAWVFSTLVVAGGTVMVVLMLRDILGGGGNTISWSPRFDLIPTIEVPSLQGEVTLTAVQPFVVALLAILFGLLVGGEPPTLLTLPLLALPILRSVITDSTMFSKFVASNKTWWDRMLRRETPSAAKSLSFCGLWNCVMSKLLILDASTDGVAVATIFLAEHYDKEGIFHARHLAMWGHGMDGWFLPLMGYTHSLSIAMLSVLFLSSVFGVAICTDPKRPLSTMLKAAGLGLTSDSVMAVEMEEPGTMRKLAGMVLTEDKSHHEEVLEYDWLTDFQMTVLEAVPQFYLQVLFVMVLDQELVEVPMLAISIVSSYICGSLSLFSCLQVICGNIATSPKERKDPANYAFLVATLLALGSLNLTAIRLFVAETCETHLWRMVTGCVVAPVPAS